jgi:hypothetical protein
MARMFSLYTSAVSAASLAITSAALGGCLMAPEGPHRGAVATGDQLAVVDDIKVWTTTTKEKVGETEYKDADGHTVGTGTVYADKTQVHTAKIWYPVQGRQQLADEDFFRIAGDQSSLDATLKMRADGKTWNHRGIGTIAGGAIGMVVGFFIPNAPVKTLLETVGGLAVAGGYYMSWYGAHEENPETHAVDRSLADRAATDYNSQIGHSVGMSMTRKF